MTSAASLSGTPTQGIPHHSSVVYSGHIGVSLRYPQSEVPQRLQASLLKDWISGPGGEVRLGALVLRGLHQLNRPGFSHDRAFISRVLDFITRFGLAVQLAHQHHLSSMTWSRLGALPNKFCTQGDGSRGLPHEPLEERCRCPLGHRASIARL